MAKLTWLDRSALLSPYYTLCLSERAMHNAFARLSIPRERRPEFVHANASATTHFVSSKNKLCAVVCVCHDASDSQAEMYALLAHEAVHIWQEMCRDIGERAPGDEIEAYVIQHLTRCLIDEYLRQKEAL